MTRGIPKSLVFTVIVILIVLYIPFHNRYRIEHIDDAWSFSWAYGYWIEGDVYDSVFGYLDGDGGTSVFGRTYAFIYGIWGSATSWSRPAGYVLSVFFLFGATALWRKNLLILGYTPSITVSFVLIMLLMEAYYGMAHRLRSDALVLFLSTLSFTLYLCKRPFFSAISLCIAIETHPYGLVGLFYILSAALSELAAKKSRRYAAVDVFRFILGGFLGLGYYMALHFKWLGGLLEISNRIGGNPIFKYFFDHRYSWRHWPELVVIIAGISIFMIRKEYRNDRFIPISICMMLLFSIFLPRGNHQYIVFLYPPFILLLLYMSAKLNFLPVFLAGFLLFQIPQYAWLFWVQRDFSWPKYIARVKEIVPEDEDAMIYGPSSAWFALYDRNYKTYGYFQRAQTDKAQLPKKMYVIRNGNIRKEGGIDDLQNIEQYYKKQKIKEWFEPGHSRYLVSYWEFDRSQNGSNFLK